MVIASHCVGLTLPGMIELPGSFSGIVISPSPERGPLASQRTSLAILNSDAASAFSAPCRLTSASAAAMASNLLGAVTNASPVYLVIAAATRSPNRGWVLSPVPTAVPPIASSSTCGSAAAMCARACASCAAYPENSWPSVSGVASCRCVRPILTMSANSAALAASVACRAASAGTRSRVTVSAAATFIAVGNTSFDDWPRLTSSFGCTKRDSPRTPPRISEARLARTSLTVMLFCVPEPVCQTASGNSPSCFPASASSAAATIATAVFGGSLPRPTFTSAAARLTISSARMSAGGIFSVETRKYCSERCVCAPHKCASGTSIGPNVSRSVRVACAVIYALRHRTRGAMCAALQVILPPRAHTAREWAHASGPARKKGARRRPLSWRTVGLRCRRLLRRCGRGRCCWRCCGRWRARCRGSVFCRRLHRQAQPALVVRLEDLDLHHLAFLDVVGDLVDALLGDLRNVQQPVLAREHLHDGAEVEQAQHRAFVDAADFDVGGDVLDAL